MSGSWSNSYQSSLTLPTGATTGARIVMDGTGDTILVFDASNQLITSIAATADPAGAYPAGVTTFDRAGNLFVNLANGSASLGALAGGNPQTSTAGAVTSLFPPGKAPWTILSAPEDATYDTPPQIELIGGKFGTVVGGTDVPMAKIVGSPSQASDIEVVVGGAMVRMDASSSALQSPVTWQPIPYGTGWSGTTSYNGSGNWQALRMRLDAEDNVWLLGAFTVGASASSTIANLPAPFRPKQQFPLIVQSNLSGTQSFFSTEIGPTGNWNVLSQTGGSIAAGREYLINAKYPLGNLT